MRKNGNDEQATEAEISRRGFLQGVGIATAGISGVAALSGCSSQATSAETTASVVESSEGSSSSAAPVIEELPIPEWPAPETTSYECDVLVVGGGWAGLMAAREASNAGQKVILVDKARPGFSAYSAWSNAFGYFSEQYGDDLAYTKKLWAIQSDYSCNQNWLEKWAELSETAYEVLNDWNMFHVSPFMSETEDKDGQTYYDTKDVSGYLNKVVTVDNDRHWLFDEHINEVADDLVEYTMITDVIEEEGRVVGAVGFHCPSATVINFACKAVIMCVGAGSYKPGGYPTGADTFDGDYIGYMHGLPIAGKEYNDFHTTLEMEPGNVWREWGSCVYGPNALVRANFLETAWPEIMASRAWEPVTGIAHTDFENLSEDDLAGPGGPPGTVGEQDDSEAIDADSPIKILWIAGRQEDMTSVEGDPRTGSIGDPPLLDRIGGTTGASACGMGVHKGEGVFIGNEATTKTSLPGLYYAGDCLSSSLDGAMYFGAGTGSSGSAVQGMVAGQEAAEYAAEADAGYVSQEVLDAQTEEILAPMQVETGFSPVWLRDVLQATMNVDGVNGAKTEDFLKAALTRVEWMRDNQVNKMYAFNGHQLRICHEVKHCVLNAEMKLRAALERKESRGLHFRYDYPYRDDENFLCHITLKKGEDGSMETSRVSYEEDWVGDTSEDYAQRYPVRYPGEKEAKDVPEQAAIEDIMAATLEKILKED